VKLISTTRIKKSRGLLVLLTALFALYASYESAHTARQTGDKIIPPEIKVVKAA